MFAKLFHLIFGGSVSFNSWDGGIEKLKRLSVKRDTAKVAKVLDRMWTISSDQNIFKPDWIMSVDDDGNIASLSCFRHGEGKGTNIPVKGGGYVLRIRVDTSDIRRFGESSRSQSHFVQYLKGLCRSQLR